MSAAVIAQQPTAGVDTAAAPGIGGDHHAQAPVDRTSHPAHAATHVLPGSAVFVLVFVFVVAIGMLAPRILGGATYAPSTWRAPDTSSPAITAVAMCMTPNGWQPDDCAARGAGQCC